MRSEARACPARQLPTLMVVLASLATPACITMQPKAGGEGPDASAQPSSRVECRITVLLTGNREFGRIDRSFRWWLAAPGSEDVKYHYDFGAFRWTHSRSFQLSLPVAPGSYDLHVAADGVYRGSAAVTLGADRSCRPDPVRVGLSPVGAAVKCELAFEIAGPAGLVTSRGTLGDVYWKFHGIDGTPAEYMEESTSLGKPPHRIVREEWLTPGTYLAEFFANSLLAKAEATFKVLPDGRTDPAVARAILSRALYSTGLREAEVVPLRVVAKSPSKGAKSAKPVDEKAALALRILDPTGNLRKVAETGDEAYVKQAMRNALQGLSSDDPEESFRAMLYCALIIRADTGESILDLLKSDDPAVREKAIKAVEDAVGEKIDFDPHKFHRRWKQRQAIEELIETDQARE